MKASQARLVLLVHTSLGIDYQPQALEVPLVCCQCESCDPIFSLKLHVCIAVNEQAHTLHATILTRKMKASRAFVVLLVHIYLDIDHQLQATELPFRRSQYESCMPMIILKMHVCIAVDKQAAWKGQLDCLKLMIDAKASVSQQISTGMTGLGWACQGGYLECVRQPV
jgi:hypothetical protein